MRSGQAVLNRISRGQAPVADREFAEDRAHVCMNRPAAEEEGLSNFSVTQTPSDEA